jgi:hypothetical protein
MIFLLLVLAYRVNRWANNDLLVVASRFRCLWINLRRDLVLPSVNLTTRSVNWLILYEPMQNQPLWLPTRLMKKGNSPKMSLLSSTMPISRSLWRPP